MRGDVKNREKKIYIFLIGEPSVPIEIFYGEKKP